MQTHKIYLARHGEICKDGEKRFIGHTNLALNDNGIYQAERLRDELADIQFSIVCCSDLSRSVSTANIICKNRGKKPTIIKDLREIDMGLWDGLSFDEVSRCYPGEFEKRGTDIANYKPPKGESFAQCAARVLSAMDSILKSHKGEMLIVGHAGVNRIIICQAMGMALENIFKIKQEYGCLNILTSSNGKQKVEIINRLFI